MPADNVVPIRPFDVLDWSAIASPLPVTPWICEGLNIAAGRPFVFCGEAGSKKSWLAQALLVHAASGTPLLEQFTFRREGLRGLYIDYEQGELESRARFQALAAGSGVSERLFGRIGYVWQPIETMFSRRESDRKRILEDMVRLVSGYDLAVVDSLLDCQPGADENSSDIVCAMKLSTVASTRTGCAIGFVDHASGKRDANGARSNAQRGHSAKKGASSVLFVASGADPDPILVTCERSQNVRFSARPPPFAFQTKDVPGGVLVSREAIPGETPKPGRPHSVSDATVRTFYDDLCSKLKRTPSKDELLASLRSFNLRIGDSRALTLLRSYRS